ncbi:MAG TPA: non-canonical purine NTP pyrophosphatase, partial [Pirellulales bacterium]|nr:non-canonical purine NTP pyrophosphatase [Pirellulales bacterium]
MWGAISSALEMKNAVANGGPALASSLAPPYSLNMNLCLIIGTANRKKGQELAELVAPLGVRVRTLADFPPAEVAETGDTFAANAAIKATEHAKRLG